MGALVFIAAALPYALTATQRGYYSDDYSLRRLIVEHEWFRVYPEYYQIWGGFRLLGAMAILLNFAWLWQIPALMHLMFSLAWAAAALMLFSLVRRWLRCDSSALMASALFIAYPTTTTSVCWPTAAAEMLPALLLFLTALHMFVGARHSEKPDVLRSTSLWIYLCYGLSILFHDQHLGAALVFATIAATSAPSGRRVRAAVETWPFFAISFGIGLASVITSSGSIRPLSPSGAGALSNSLQVFQAFTQWSISAPVTHWISGTGFREGLIEWSESDLSGLIITWCAIAVMLLTLRLGFTPGRLQQSKRRSWEVILAGSALWATSLLIMAARADGAISERHTLWPSLGLALAVGGMSSLAASVSFARMVHLTCVLAIGLLSVVKMGYVYEWSLRTTTTQAILRDVALLDPPPQKGELLVIDNVRRLGRGFADSWGLSDAISLARGTEVRVSTSLRVKDGALFANAAWDRAWPVDQPSTRFFDWNHLSASLVPISAGRFWDSHPELAAASRRTPLQVTIIIDKEAICP